MSQKNPKASQLPEEVVKGLLEEGEGLSHNTLEMLHQEKMGNPVLLIGMAQFALNKLIAWLSLFNSLLEAIDQELLRREPQLGPTPERTPLTTLDDLDISNDR